LLPQEGLQMAVREGEQSTKMQRNEKKPNLSWLTVAEPRE